MIACLVTAWDNVLPNSVSNFEMGKALLGVVVHPAARSLSMVVTPENMDQLAKTGVTDNVNN